jgi:ribosomal protein S18 acetylase RimI-like enzyme
MIELRKATEADAEGVAYVLHKSYNIVDLEEGKSVFQRELHKHHVYIIAVHEGRVIGLVTWTMHGLPKHGLLELDRIAVLPDHQGKGVAQKLFKAMEDDAQEFYSNHGAKIRKVYLLTHATNERAHSFYTKLGMEKESVLPSHYYAGVDEFVFSKFY